MRVGGRGGGAEHELGQAQQVALRALAGALPIAPGSARARAVEAWRQWARLSPPGRAGGCGGGSTHKRVQIQPTDRELPHAVIADSRPAVEAVARRAGWRALRAVGRCLPHEPHVSRDVKTRCAHRCSMRLRCSYAFRDAKPPQPDRGGTRPRARRRRRRRRSWGLDGRGVDSAAAAKTRRACGLSRGGRSD